LITTALLPERRKDAVEGLAAIQKAVIAAQAVERGAVVTVH